MTEPATLIRITNNAKQNVGVQFLSLEGKDCQPRIALAPGQIHIVRAPADLDHIYYRSSSPRASQFMQVEYGILKDGAFETVEK